MLNYGIVYFWSVRRQKFLYFPSIVLGNTMSQEAKGVMDCKGRVKFSFLLADKITPGEITKEYTNKIKRLILKFIEKDHYT